ncbi:hypothetical protein BDY19DRAFT_924232 [Irpex rosettiformis]|uniref:Uncharacterized protein n=1 Tax=Irpex rosettiformis TaxID=378272 RepID=A0ACB8UDR0_9APHY|nr:hypothetical protein BDY19DRAFT_924232 [Irpex rosettiformis]
MAPKTSLDSATEAEPAASRLSNLERLILVQAVYEFGNNAWAEVSKLLSSHPMLSHSDLKFSPTFCNVVYLRLMQDAGLECPSDMRKAPVHRQLAKIHYDKRVEEVRALLLAEESKFRKIVGEIDDIRAGRWDSRILEGDKSESIEVETTPVLEPEDTNEEPEYIPIEDEFTVISQQPIEEPQAIEPEPIDVQDGIAEEVDVEMQSVKPQPLEQLENHPLKEDQTMAEGYVVSEDTAPESMEDAVPQETTGPPEANMSSRDVSPAASARLDHIVDTNAAQEEMQLEEVEELTAVEQPEKVDAASLQQEVMAPEAEIKDESEPEVEAEADAEVEMAVASDGEQSTRTDGKRKASEALSEPPRERKRAREDSEPVDEDEHGPSANKNRRRAQAPDKKFQNVIGMLHSTISQHRYGNIFHNPIKKSEAPDYHDIVKRPMDLKTIKARVKDGLISNSLEFQRDIYLMFANAMMYNRPGSDVHNMAEEMMLESEIHINSFRQTEGFHRS